ncbi:unnamed protein product [Cochlearia groenlandica]
MVQKLEAKGMKNNNMWDDGSNHDDVTKIYLRGGSKGIDYFYVDYVKSGKVIEGSSHGQTSKSGYTTMLEINTQKNEYLESVDVYYINLDGQDGIQALQFKTNFKTFELIGENERCSKFTLAVPGKKIVGFHGSGWVHSLGAYFTWITPTKVEVKGGKGGKEWDDGHDHENISKIYVRGGFEGIQFIKFDYVKNGQLENGQLRGVSSRGFTGTFEIDHLNEEYLVSVEGYYDDASGIIQGIQFKTNKKTFDLMGYDKGQKFSLASNGNKIIGFHGYAEKGVNSIGVYFITAPPGKLDYVGQIKGFLWDDGSNNDGIRKVFVDAGGSISCIRFEYDNKGKVNKTHRRLDVTREKEFVLDYPNEFITSIEGTMFDGMSQFISSIIIKTSKGRTSPTLGFERTDYKSKTFVLEKKGSALVGFYGWVEYATLYALGAYYRPLPPPPDSEKLESQGGDGGVYWDDGGTFNGVRKIYIGISKNYIAFIKFMYFKSANMVFGDDHGNKDMLTDVQELELNFPFEQVTSVEGSYDDKSGFITMLRFKTNQKTSKDYGIGTSSSFVLHKSGHQIVGFHGMSSNVLHKIGVHVLPTNFKFVF